MENPVKTITRLDQWRVARGYTFEALGDLLGVSTQSAFRYCLHPLDEQHRRPSKTAGRKLYELTGSIHSDNYAELITLDEAGARESHQPGSCVGETDAEPACTPAKLEAGAQ